MANQAVDAITLEEEKRQLRSCRWAFQLLAYSMVAGIVLSVWATPVQEPNVSFHTPQRWVYLASVILDGALAAPAAYILSRVARSTRWRFSARTFLVLFAIDATLQLMLCFLRPPDQSLGQRQPETPLVGIIAEAAFLIQWSRFWFLAVLVAEFGIACKANALVTRTENLGYLILVGAANELIFAAWNAPAVYVHRDEFSEALSVMGALLLLVASSWTIILLVRASDIAMYLSHRCAEVRRLTLEEDEEEEF